jgi:DNA-binding transcriptional regulator YdaS (Cro superfamily)
MTDFLAKAIDLAGGETKLSRALGLHKTAVYSWTSCPPGRVLEVCQIVGWQVTPHQLRPDLYPNETDGMPQDKGNTG